MDTNTLDLLCKNIYTLAELFYPARKDQSGKISAEQLELIKSVASKKASELKFDAERNSFEVTRVDNLFVVSLKLKRPSSNRIPVGGELYLVLDQSPKVLCTLAGR